MKKILFMFVAAAMVLTACNNEPVRVYTNAAAVDAQGSYVGTWTITSSDASFGNNGMLEGIEGTLSIDTISGGASVDSLKNQAVISIYRGPLPDDETTWTKTSQANMSHAEDDVVFNNDLTTNALGSAFFGRTSDALQHVTITCAFTDKIADPAHPGKKKNVVNSYVFNGTRQ